MTLADKLTKLKESELFKLVFDGKTLGLRIKLFDVNKDVFLYYDFTLEMVTDRELQSFVKSIEKMRAVPLHRNGSGLLVSDDEVKHNLIIQEFETPDDAAKALNMLRQIYETKRSEG